MIWTFFLLANEYEQYGFISYLILYRYGLNIEFFHFHGGEIASRYRRHAGQWFGPEIIH